MGKKGDGMCDHGRHRGICGSSPLAAITQTLSFKGEETGGKKVGTESKANTAEMEGAIR